MSAAILLISALLQSVSVLMAARLVWLGDRRVAWAAISIALALIAVLRWTEYVRFRAGTLQLPDDMSIEWIALAISVFCVTGMALFGPASQQFRKTREALIKSRAILQSLLDNSPAYIAVRDTHGRFVLVNRIYAEVFGLSVEDITGKRVQDVLPTEFANELASIEERILHDGKAIVHEHDRPLTPDAGRIVSVRFPIRDEQNNIIGVGGIGTDISELDRTRRDFAVQQDRYNLATEAGRIGLWEWDPKTDKKYVSPNLERMVGCAEGEHIETMAAWIERLYPGEGEQVRSRLDEYVASNAIIIAEYPVKIRDGREMWLETRATPTFDDDGNVRTIIGVDTDITDRKTAEDALAEREALLDSVFENMPVGILIKDTDHVVERWNRKYLEWYGRAAREMIGRQSHHVEGFQSDTDAQRMIDQENEVIESGETSHRQIERPFVDGRLHTVSVTKFPIFDWNGEITRVGSVSVDMTDQIETQNALKMANERLESASRAKSDFLAHMSHELRTPLNSIIGFSQMTREEMLGPIENTTYLEYAGLINDSAAHLLEVINDILDLAKVESGELTLNETDIDIGALIDGVVSVMPRRDTDSGPSILFDLPESPIMLRADERMMRQVLLNILSNAIKFTPEGGEVRVEVGFEADSQVCVVVEDTGVGMAPEDIPRALEPFGQVRKSASLAHDGTGLGLSITQKLLALHHAELTIESDIGKGVRVRIIFPKNRTLHAV